MKIGKKKLLFIITCFTFLLLGTGKLYHETTSLFNPSVEAGVNQTGTTTDELNLRKGAGMNFSIIKVLPKGTQVNIIDQTGVWLKVKFGNFEGYVHSDYIKTTLTKPSTGTTTTPDLNLRKGPGTNHNIIRALPKGTKLTIISQTGSWMKVKVGAQDGYVHSAYVKVESISNQTSPASKTGTTTTWVNFRKGAGTHYASIKVLPKGQNLTILNDNGKWMKVRVGTQEGWVSSAYIKVINTTPSTSRPNPPASGKTVYLTFDDGPSKNTNKILDILKQNNIQGTFFVLGTSIKNNKNSNALLNRMVKEGHYIGLHSMSHDKSKLYQGSGASRNFLNEMLELQREVKYRTGFESKLYRPPYGTINNFTQSHITTMKNSNLRGWDWNVDSNDWNSKTTTQVMDNVKSGLHLRRDSDIFVVLFHEHDITIEALPKVIEHFKSLGYEFKVYDPSNHFQMNLIKEPNL